jgi:hypothetical protein
MVPQSPHVRCQVKADVAIPSDCAVGGAQIGRPHDVRFAMKALPAAHSAKVRFCGKTGKHLLASSFSGFDPIRTFGDPQNAFDLAATSSK